MVGREPSTPGVTPSAGYPGAPIDLDGKHQCGPGKVESPAPTEMLGERVFRDWFLESRCPDEDEQSQLEW
jgi:hypothetical protein